MAVTQNWLLDYIEDELTAVIPSLTAKSLEIKQEDQGRFDITSKDIRIRCQEPQASRHATILSWPHPRKPHGVLSDGTTSLTATFEKTAIEQLGGSNKAGILLELESFELVVVLGQDQKNAIRLQIHSCTVLDAKLDNATDKQTHIHDYLSIRNLITRLKSIGTQSSLELEEISSQQFSKRSNQLAALLCPNKSYRTPTITDLDGVWGNGYQLGQVRVVPTQVEGFMTQVVEPQVIEPVSTQDEGFMTQVVEPRIIEPVSTQDEGFMTQVAEPQVIEIVEPQILEPQVVEPQVVESYTEIAPAPYVSASQRPEMDEALLASQQSPPIASPQSSDDLSQGPVCPEPEPDLEVSLRQSEALQSVPDQPAALLNVESSLQPLATVVVFSESGQRMPHPLYMKYARQRLQSRTQGKPATALQPTPDVFEGPNKVDIASEVEIADEGEVEGEVSDARRAPIADVTMIDTNIGDPSATTTDPRFGEYSEHDSDSPFTDWESTPPRSSPPLSLQPLTARRTLPPNSSAEVQLIREEPSSDSSEVSGTEMPDAIPLDTDVADSCASVQSTPTRFVITPPTRSAGRNFSGTSTAPPTKPTQISTSAAPVPTANVRVEVLGTLRNVDYGNVSSSQEESTPIPCKRKRLSKFGWSSSDSDADEAQQDPRAALKARKKKFMQNAVQAKGITPLTEVPANKVSSDEQIGLIHTAQAEQTLLGTYPLVSPDTRSAASGPHTFKTGAEGGISDIPNLPLSKKEKRRRKQEKKRKKQEKKRRKKQKKETERKGKEEMSRQKMKEPRHSLESMTNADGYRSVPSFAEPAEAGERCIPSRNAWAVDNSSTSTVAEKPARRIDSLNWTLGHRPEVSAKRL